MRAASARILALLACAALVLAAGCAEPAREPLFVLDAPGGMVPWDTTGSASLARQSYRDRGMELHCLVADGDNGGAIMLTSPAMTVIPERPVSFSFAFRSEHAMGGLLEARLFFTDAAGSPVADTLLYSITAGVSEQGRGYTEPWVSYTRAVKVPAGAVNATVRVSCLPERGRVWLGETSFAEGEGWLAYAATFSRHLGRNPGDRYLFTAARVVEPFGMPEPTRRETDAGLMVFERKGFVGAWPYANPREQDRVEYLEERVPRGSVAPLAFGVKALENLSGIEVSLTIPPSKDNISLRTRPRIYQGRFAATRFQGSWSRVFGIRARMLEPPRSKPLPRGENLYYWIDISVPANAEAGLYEGELSIRADDHQQIRLPFRISVEDIELPGRLEDRTIGLYYYPPEDPELMRTHFEDMAAHGANSVSLSGSFVQLSPAGNLRVDWDRVVRLDRIVSLMRRHNMLRPTSLYIVDLLDRLELPGEASLWTDQHKDLYRRAVRLMDTTARQRGWPRLMFFPVDEPANDAAHMELARLTLGILRDMEGILTLCDLNTPGSIEELTPSLDAVVMQISSVSPRTLGLAGDERTVLSYMPCFGSSDVGDDAAYHRAIPGWWLPRTGMDGIYYFAYQAPAGDPYDELDRGHRDWCAAYPGSSNEEVWPSPEWQGIRRGVEDLRLIQLARGLIGRCDADSRRTVQDAGERARRGLEEILGRLEPSGAGVIYQLHHELDTYTAEQWRGELMDLVLGMQDALAGSSP